MDLPKKLIVLFSLTIITTQGTKGWPDGTYGIPMSKTGCPPSQDFEWVIASRTHHTEMGSHGSPDIHLAGIYSKQSDRITQTFCMKTVPASDGGYSWQPGRYCIYKKGVCPAGFQVGWVYWDDAAPYWGDTIQNNSGNLPDGTYDRNTKIFFCCRNDGLASNPIHLPNSTPFHLVKWGDACQSVHGMQVNEEWVYWKDESNFNLNSHGGLFPRMTRSKFPIKFTKLFYCYYTPKPVTNNFNKVLVAVYVIAGTVGGIVAILFFMCICQRIFSRKHKSTEDTGLANALARDRPEYPHEPVVMYRVEGGGGGATGGMASNAASATKGTASAGKKAVADDNMSANSNSVNEDDPGVGAAVSTPDEHTPMLPPAPPGLENGVMRPISLPPSYEDVMREDSRLDSPSQEGPLSLHHDPEEHDYDYSP